MFQLQCVKFGEHQFSNFGVQESEFVEFLPRLGCNLTIVLHSAQWHSEMNWNSAISIAVG